MFFSRKTAYEKELAAVLKKERKFLDEHSKAKESFLSTKLENIVPKKLQGTLDSAFAKAFDIVFEKGTKVIEKTYDKKGLEMDYRQNEYINSAVENRKSLRAFSKKAKAAGNRNLLFSGAAGIGMGALGIGIPDIPVLTGFILKSIYEIAIDYGFEYNSEKEKAFILWVIEGAVSYGDKSSALNKKIDDYIKTGTLPEDYSREEAVKSTAKALSKELLYVKFVQGIPVIGVLGGFYDAVYVKRINKYANIKYRKRQLIKMKQK